MSTKLRTKAGFSKIDMKYTKNTEIDVPSERPKKKNKSLFNFFFIANHNFLLNF